MQKKLLIILLSIFAVISIQGDDIEIGLALSGGGARGFAHIGLLKVIDEIGLEIDYISGTSFGALVGAMYSLGYSPSQIEEILTEFDFRTQLSDSIERKNLFIEEKRWLDYGSVRFNIDDDYSLNMPLSILTGNNMLNILAKYLNRGMYYRNFDDFPIPFRCNATNLTTGKNTTFSHGNIIDVVRASMAFPTVLEPFEIEGEMFVDGGVKDNLPVQALLDMGADYIISSKVNSPLKKRDECQDLISVLNQTISINMNVWVEKSLAKTDFLFEPELGDYGNTSFAYMDEIVAMAEKQARENIESLLEIKSKIGDSGYTRDYYVMPNRIFIKTITARGNNRIHSSKIKLYSGLEEGRYYSYKEIEAGIKRCYNTKNFYWVYPKLVYDNGDYHLEINTKEKGNAIFSIDATYDNSDDLVARFTTSLDNSVQKNSKLLASINLGGINSFELDYVKNFGDLYGAYYHFFPYLEESKMYNYNFDGNKSSRVKKFEYGLNLGIGFFIKDILICEGYLYGYQSNLYQDVAELDLPQRKFVSNGIGLKAYHENVDDLYFPTSGQIIMFNYQQSLEQTGSDESYEKMYVDLYKALPINERISIYGESELGLFRDAFLGKLFSPFQIGGIDSFTALEKHSLNHDAYQFNQIGLAYNYQKRLFISAGYQFLYRGGDDLSRDSLFSKETWNLNAGYKTPLGPLRISFSSDFKSDFDYHVSFGFTKDMFNFSKN